MRGLIRAFSLIMITGLTQLAQGRAAQLSAPEFTAIKPSEFIGSPHCPKMPRLIVEYLEKSSCLIPQAYFVKNHHNAFQIQFSKQGQNDWAVICEKGGFSSILIFWKGSTGRVSEFAKYPDEQFVSSAGYSRVISKGTLTEGDLTKEVRSQYAGVLPQNGAWGIDELTPREGRVFYYLYNNQLVILPFDYTPGPWSVSSPW